MNVVLYYAVSYQIRALDAATGKKLWQGSEIGDIYWESPIIVNGTLCITDETGSLVAFPMQNETVVTH